eukprot:SAG11_NODE_24698_length_369_cov_1.262963_1_plen_52_part_00
MMHSSMDDVRRLIKSGPPTRADLDERAVKAAWDKVAKLHLDQIFKPTHYYH